MSSLNVTLNIRGKQIHAVYYSLHAGGIPYLWVHVDSQWKSVVMVEGTPEEMRTLARKILEAVDRAEEEAERLARPVNPRGITSSDPAVDPEG